MIQGLGKREKILLFVAVLLVLVYLAVRFAIYPLFNRYFDDRQERSYLSAEKVSVDADIANISVIRDANSSAHLQLENIKQEYPLLVPNEEVDTILTTLCLSNDLRPTALSMTRPPSPTSSEEGANNDNELEQVLFTIITARMNVTGNYNSLLRLLDEVDGIQYIRITDFSYALNRQAQSGDDEANIILNFELTFLTP